MRTNLLVVVCLFFFNQNLLPQINFSTGKLSGTFLGNPTSLQFGPDGKLYVATQDGTIYRFTVQKTSTGYNVAATETITLIRQMKNRDDNGAINPGVIGRQVTGILVAGSSSSPSIYVTSSDPRIGGSGTEGSSPNGDGDLNLDTNSGILSLLSLSGGAWTKTDLVRGMPRSEENHSQNGLVLDAATNSLYVTSGGHTNAGSPSVNFAMITEYALAACLLKIDMNMINSMPVSGSGNDKYIYDIPTLDDPTRSNVGSADINDPFGGNDGLNQARMVPGGPVQVFAPGYRNIYDVVLTKTPGREGRIYAVDNGANQGWGGYPDKEGTTQVTNNYVPGEPGSLGPGVNDAQVNNLDNLHLIYKPGMQPFYGGHPTPIRANPSGAGLFWKDGAGNHFELKPTVDWPPLPVTMANPAEADYHNPGVNDGALTTFQSSTNGICEYSSTAFSNAMLGDLLTVSFDGNVYRIKLSADGSSVISNTIIASGFATTPLDITSQGDADIFPGTFWVADYVGNAIHFFEPVNPGTDGTWSTISPSNGIYPEKRHENAFTEANGKFYLMGGRGVKPVHVFDPATKAWSTAAAIPGSKELHHFQAATINNKIYIINAFTGAYPGEIPVPDIYVFDAITNTWSVQANAIPQARRRGSCATVVHNNKIYMVGGITNGHLDGTVNWTDVYDPATGIWTSLANAPKPRDHVHGAVINGKIYVAAGRRTNASANNIFNDTEPTVDVYDIVTNTWTTLPSSANIPTQRAAAGSVAFNNKLMVIGGESAQSMAHNQVQQLDPATNSWTSLPNLVTGRHGTQALVYGGNVYVAAGSSTQGGSASSELNSIELYPNSSSCSGNTTSTTMDDDKDGYSNKDEADNSTDPCSGASKPKDFDGDYISNLNDPDDDNDGIQDTMDAFHQDSQNGKNKNAPFLYPFLNGNPGTGLFGMGFTGLMINGTDPDKLYNETANGFIMGGAAGLATIPAGSGSPMGNTQQQAFQFGVAITSASATLTIESGLVSPFFNGTNPSGLKDEIHGIYAGTGDQDNYVFLGISPNYGNPAILVAVENGGILSQNIYPVTGLLSGNLALYLEINAANGTVQPKYRIASNAAPVNAGPVIFIGGKFKTTVQGPDAMAVGILGSARSGTGFSATWDYMNVYFSSSPGGSNTVRVNAGGPSVLAGGQNWQGDAYWTDTDPASPSSTYSTSGAIGGTTIGPVYQTERYGKAFTYNLPVPNGSYTVVLHFAEIWWTASGQRVMNVNIENGQGSLSNFDIFAQAGGNTALVKPFNVNVTDGSLTVAFSSVADLAKISGIEVIPASPTSARPIANAGTDITITLPTSSLQLNGSGSDPGGSITGYTWTQVSGPNTASFSSATVASPTVTNLVQGVYVFRLIVRDNENNFSDPDDVTVTVNSGGTGTTGAVRINSGGPGLNINGISWMADQYFTDQGGTVSNNAYFNNAIANTQNAEIYRSERYGRSYTYNVPVTNGAYLVRLHFAEIYWNNIGDRVFNVNVENGQGSLANFDILKEVAKNVALVKEFTVNVTDGNATIALTTLADNAKISGIEVLPTTAPPPPPPPPPPPAANNIRINSGGPELNVNGEIWSADKQYSTDPSYTYSVTSSIANTTNPDLYRTERYGKNFSYNIPVSTGTYTVKLHFAELFWTTAGSRIFNINVENQGIQNNVDLFAEAGMNKAILKTYTVNVADGNLTIAFAAITDNAKISGIEVIPASNTSLSGQPVTFMETVLKTLHIKTAPNPTTGRFRIIFEGGDGSSVDIRVVNSLGVMVETVRNHDPSNSLELGDRYNRGTYYIEVLQSGKRATTRLIRF